MDHVRTGGLTDGSPGAPRDHGRVVAGRGDGEAILAWAADTARRHGRHALRLDCVAANRRLRAYYEASGFVHRGDVAVGGAPGQRGRPGPVITVSRYELPLHAAGRPADGRGRPGANPPWSSAGGQGSPQPASLAAR